MVVVAGGGVGSVSRSGSETSRCAVVTAPTWATTPSARHPLAETSVSSAQPERVTVVAGGTGSVAVESTRMRQRDVDCNEARMRVNSSARRADTSSLPVDGAAKTVRPATFI